MKKLFFMLIIIGMMVPTNAFAQDMVCNNEGPKTVDPSMFDYKPNKETPKKINVWNTNIAEQYRGDITVITRDNYNYEGGINPGVYYKNHFVWVFTVFNKENDKRLYYYGIAKSGFKNVKFYKTDYTMSVTKIAIKLFGS